MKNIEYIAFDADDTLWVNELYFYEFEQKFCTLMQPYLPADKVSQELFRTEMKNLHLYGYGIKGMMLCMVETICNIIAQKGESNRQGKEQTPPADEAGACIREVIRLGQELIEHPIELLDGVKETLSQLSKRYKLILITKGDLLDQERKVSKSGLKDYFHHIEILSDKQPEDYQRMMERLDCPPEKFLMIGNSVKSDILPVLQLNGYAVHIPYPITWQHEQHEEEVNHPYFLRLNKITEILHHL